MKKHYKAHFPLNCFRNLHIKLPTIILILSVSQLWKQGSINKLALTLNFCWVWNLIYLFSLQLQHTNLKLLLDHPSSLSVLYPTIALELNILFSTQTTFFKTQCKPLHCFKPQTSAPKSQHLIYHAIKTVCPKTPPVIPQWPQTWLLADIK